MDRSKLFRNKADSTVLVVPTKARKYRKALYIFDFFLSGFGLTAFILGIVLLVLRKDTLMPVWIFGCILVLGSITIVIGGLGGRGAVISYRCLEGGHNNWWLIALSFVVGAVIVIEVAGITWLIIEYGVIANSTVSSKSDFLGQKLDDQIKKQAASQPEAWWDWQKAFVCCGYDNNTIPAPLATGKYCTTSEDTTATACKDRFWHNISQQGIPIGIFFAFFIISQVIVFTSAVCLSCLIKAQEPVYRDT